MLQVRISGRSSLLLDGDIDIVGPLSLSLALLCLSVSLARPLSKQV